MSEKAELVPLVALSQAWAAMARELAAEEGRTRSSRLRVFLDCDGRLKDLIRSGIDFVEYFDRPQEAEVCVRVTNVVSRRRPRECTVAFIGKGHFEGIEAMARVSLVRP